MLDINKCTQRLVFPSVIKVSCQQGQWKVICKHCALNPSLLHTPIFCQNLLSPPPTPPHHVCALSRNNLAFPNRPMSNIYTGRLFNSLFPTDAGERKGFLYHCEVALNYAALAELPANCSAGSEHSQRSGLIHRWFISSQEGNNLGYLLRQAKSYSSSVLSAKIECFTTVAFFVIEAKQHCASTNLPAFRASATH